MHNSSKYFKTPHFQECRINVQKYAKMCKNVPIVHNTVRAEECAEGEVSFNSHYSQLLLFIHISFGFFSLKCICPNFKTYFSTLKNVFGNSHLLSSSFIYQSIDVYCPYLAWIQLTFSFFSFSRQHCFCNLVLLCRDQRWWIFLPSTNFMYVYMCTCAIFINRIYKIYSCFIYQQINLSPCDLLGLRQEQQEYWVERASKLHILVNVDIFSLALNVTVP